MSRILDALKAFFEEDDWPSAQLEDTPALQMKFRGREEEWGCYVHVNDELEQFVFHSVLPMTVPEAKRAAMAEFIARANYGVSIGNFEMDFNDGELRYKTGLDVEDVNLTHSLIKGIVYPNVLMVDQYIGGIQKILASDIEPEVAIAEIEQEE